MEHKLNILHERIKELRKGNGWNQSEFAAKIGTDTRMISLYESKKSVPSVEVLVKIAEVFNVSIDYLTRENAPRMPMDQNGDKELFEKLSEIEKLSDRDKDSVKHIIDSLIAKNKMKELVSKVG